MYIKITTTISPLKEACKVPQTHWYNTDHSHSWGTIQWRDLELETTGKKESCCEIGRAHVWTPVTPISRMPSSAWKKKKQKNIKYCHYSFTSMTV